MCIRDSPATGWFEMVRIPNKEAITVANLAEQTWLTRYPWPRRIIFDKGTEFMGEFKKMIQNDYGITPKVITARNPQANAIIERIHQTIGNTLRTFELQETEDEDPWAGVLSAVMFAVRATYHTTTQATPAQLVFGRDAILNTRFVADWNLIQQRKQARIESNNKAENKSRRPYRYQVGQRVMVKNDQSRKYGKNPFSGPYLVSRVNDNGTIRIRKGAVQQTYNVRNVHPYKGD